MTKSYIAGTVHSREKRIKKQVLISSQKLLTLYIYRLYMMIIITVYDIVLDSPWQQFWSMATFLFLGCGKRPTLRSSLNSEKFRKRSGGEIKSAWAI